MSHRKIAIFDIETTGLDIVNDRIVSFAAVRGEFGCYSKSMMIPMENVMAFKCNPGVEMKPEVVNVHGITNEEVKALPSFTHFAPKIAAFMQDFHLGGYNVRNFDLPMLAQEMERAGADPEWLKDKLVIDACTIFRRKEERTLSVAVEKFCGHPHTDAHSALADALATYDVLEGELAHYPDLFAMSAADLHAYCDPERRVDLAGKIVLTETGTPVYNFGKVKGTAVVKDPGFGRWMLRNDFTEDTKRVVSKLIGIDTSGGA